MTVHLVHRLSTSTACVQSTPTPLGVDRADLDNEHESPATEGTMSRRRKCTCTGTAPGWPQHESYCATVSIADTESEWWDDESTEGML